MTEGYEVSIGDGAGYRITRLPQSYELISDEMVVPFGGAKPFSLLRAYKHAPVNYDIIIGEYDPDDYEIHQKVMDRINDLRMQ